MSDWIIHIRYKSDFESAASVEEEIKNKLNRGSRYFEVCKVLDIQDAKNCLFVAGRTVGKISIKNLSLTDGTQLVPVKAE